MNRFAVTSALVLALAGCTLPAGFIPLPPTPSVTPSPTRAEYTHTPKTTPAQAESSPTASPTPPAFCLVETGLPAGTVYIRRGPGMSFPVVGYATQGGAARADREHRPGRLGRSPQERGSRLVLCAALV